MRLLRQLKQPPRFPTLGWLLILFTLLLAVLWHTTASLSAPAPSTPAAASDSSISYLPFARKSDPTPTSTPMPTVTPLPGTGTTFYLCYDSQRTPKQFLSAQPCPQANFALFIYPVSGFDTRDFAVVLPGDITGASYSFEVLLGSSGSTTVQVSAILRRNGAETTLASTIFTVHSLDYTAFTATLSGIDPAAAQGDELVLRVRSLAGSDAAMLISQSHQTFVRIR